MSKDHRCYGQIRIRAFGAKKPVKKGNTLAFHWCLFETEYYMAAWRYEISRPEES